MAADGTVSTQIAVNVGFTADVAAKLVTAFKTTDADGSGYVENEEVRSLAHGFGRAGPPTTTPRVFSPHYPACFSGRR